jgi:hypothetical protein
MAGGYTQGPPVGQKPAATSPRDHQRNDTDREPPVPRPILILLIVLAVIVGALFVLASTDGDVPVTRVEQPVTNAAPR